MADTLIQEKGEVQPEQLFGTAEEFQQRIKSEPGFYKVFRKAMEEGRVVYGPKPEAVPPVEVAPAPVEPVEEEVTVKIKKSDLGKYSTVGEVYKAKSAADTYISNLEAQIKELRTQQSKSPVIDNSMEIEKLKQEKAELEKKLNTPAPAPVALDFPVFDDLQNLSGDELKEKLYEAENLKKVYAAAQKTRDALIANKALEAQIADIKVQMDKMRETQETALKMASQTAEEQKRALEIDRTFANITELQAKYDDLKTPKTMREIDAEYSSFCDRLCMAENKYSNDDMNKTIQEYFHGTGPDAEALRKRIGDNGLFPPDGVDKYLKVREILNSANDRKLSLDEAYVLQHYKNGGVKAALSESRAAEAQRVERVVNQRQEFAQVMDSSKVDPLPTSTADPDEAEFIKAFERNSASGKTFGQIKNSSREKALYDKFYEKWTGRTIAWEKF